MNSDHFTTFDGRASSTDAACTCSPLATVGTGECTPDITIDREEVLRRFAAAFDQIGGDTVAALVSAFDKVDAALATGHNEYVVTVRLDVDSAEAAALANAATNLRSELAATQATREAYRLALVEIASVDCLERLTIARRALGTEHVPPAPAVHDFTGHRHNLTRDIEKLVDVHAVNELEAMRTFGQLLRDKRTVAEALATMLLAEVTP